ncbi:MAG: VOC family protein [Kofleriaceae bacterium]|nr:VOC family protein [Kofleriaceae bacterium]
MLRLADTALLVRDHDEALDFYVGILGFEVVEDSSLETKRWVRIKAGAAGLVLRLATSDEQRARVGNQTGGSVLLFVETDNFLETHAQLVARGVKFVEAPRTEAFGLVAVFTDLYGNRIDLIEPRGDRAR